MPSSSSLPSPDRLVIARRFNGPPQSGNGGYCAGLLAGRWQARHGRQQAVEVTLRAPLPLDEQLEVMAMPGDELALMHRDILLAQARGVDLVVEPPAAPSLEQAAAAGALGRLRAARLQGNAYLTCFGCGVSREAHEGLRIVPSPVGDAGVVASDWTPDAAMADTQGVIPDEVVWAALDCPAGIAWNYRLEDAPPLVTGRMTVAIDGPVRAGQTHRVIGWPIEADGRKLHAGSAIFDAEGRLLARSRQLWLIPKA